jgi:hypothetical protein
MPAPTSIGKSVRDRIKTAVLRSEGDPLFRQTQQNRTPVIVLPPTMEGIVTTAITAATISGGVITYGQGMVQIVIDTNTSGVYTLMNNAGYPSPVLVLNGSTTTCGVPIGTIVGVYWYNNRFGLSWVDCGN